MKEHHAWARQRELKKRFSLTDIPALHEMAHLIGQIQYGNVDPDFQTNRARALFAIYYLTACRASEITKVKTLRKRKLQRETIIDKDGARKIIYNTDNKGIPKVTEWKEDHQYIGLTKSNIKTAVYNSQEYLEIRTENRKNKARKTKLLPIPISLEKDISKYIMDYIDKLENDEPLFDFCPRRAAQIINETTGFNLHFIRHIRATHLITLYDFNEQMLVKFMGWTDSRPAKSYMELSSATLAREFYKGTKT